MAAKIMEVTGKGPRGGRLLVFHCPGCKYGHPLEIEVPACQGWTWNGSLDLPTFTPSLLIHGHPPSTPRCHSYVTDGKIQFLSDCEHELAGQTVEIPDFD